MVLIPDLAELVDQLRTTLGKLELALTVVDDAIVWTDEKGCIQWCNRSFDELVGLKHIEVLGQNLMGLFSLSENGCSVSIQTHPVNVVLGNHRQGCGVYEFQKFDHKFILEISTTATHLEENKISVILVIRDITKRKEIELELLRSNAELEDFAYVASHDLREPLRKITNFTELFVRRYKGKIDAEADKFIFYILDGATRMQVLIDDLLTYSRIGRGELRLESTNLNSVADQVLSDLHSEIQNCRALITRDPLPTLMASPVQMAELLQNLIGNALKFHSASSPHIHISAKLSEDSPSNPQSAICNLQLKEWIISVRDNGIGIDPQYFDRIFKIFQRLHRREDYPGTGIGLAICKKIAERHKGRIWVESQPGKGAVFYIGLPQY